MAKRHLAILRENARRLRDGGASEAEINQYLADNDATLDQVLAIPAATPEILNRLLENEKNGEWERSQAEVEAARAKAEKSRIRVEALEKAQGVARSFGDTLLYGTADELESALTGQDVDQIRAEQKEFQEKNPELAIGAGLVGAVANPMGSLGIVGKGATFGGKVVRGGINAAAQGGLYGLGSGEGGIGNRLSNALDSAVSGAVFGAAVPVAAEGVKAVGRAAKGVGNFINKTVDKVPLLSGLKKSSEEIADDVFKMTGEMPSTEMVGSAARDVAHNVRSQVQAKSKALYDAVDDAAIGKAKVMDNSSNLYKAVKEIGENSTKSGQRELAGIWDDLPHAQNEPANYNMLKSLRSRLSAKSAVGSDALSGADYAKLADAVEQDMFSMLDDSGQKAWNAAKSFFKNEMQNPNSATNAVNRLVGKAGKEVSDSVLGNRIVSSATGKAWKASELSKVLDMVSPETSAPLRNSIAANITTKAQFNRMTPDQVSKIYNDPKMAEKIFNSGPINFITDKFGAIGDFLMKASQGDNSKIQRFLPSAGLTGALFYNRIKDLE